MCMTYCRYKYVTDVLIMTITMLQICSTPFRGSLYDNKISRTSYHTNNK